MSRFETISRRGLLRRGAALAAAGPYMLTSGALGAYGRPSAGGRLTLGFIGVGWMGGDHLKIIVNNPAFKVLAIADIDKVHLDNALAKVGPDGKGYHDYRDLLARRDIDAVFIATPDHWHARIAIDACAAGKDVYCEKPLSLTVLEALAMAQAARRNGTVFQTGSMQRSYTCFRKACEWVRSGRIGKLIHAEATIGGGPVGDWEPVQPPPPELDWNTWLGPAPWADYTPKRCHINFRWFYDYSGGTMTDWGAHHNDIVQWGFGTDDTMPIKSEPLEYAFPSKGQFDTATRFKIKHTYANGLVLYTQSSGQHDGAFFQGSDGWIQVNRGGYKVSDPSIEQEPLGAGEVHLRRSPGETYEGHHMDWLECIKTRQRPITDVEIGAHSAIICHLGNIAIRTGKTIHWDPVRMQITNDPSLNRWLSKPYRDPWRL